MSDIKIIWDEDYYQCGTAGCSGGETFDILIFVDGEEVSHINEGGCFGTGLLYSSVAVKRILEELGHNVTLIEK